MKIRDLGEFGLIERLRAIAGEPPEGELWIGDDAAVLRAPAGTIFFTADLLVQGVHFDLELTGPEDLGYKSIAVNASDIAAMGGTPRRATVSLGLHASLDVEWVERLYMGMKECCDELGLAIAGGDVSRSDCLLISVAMLGNPAGRRVVTRAGALVGDRVCVTGTLGASAMGLRLLRAGIREPRDIIDAHLRPKARVREVEVLRRYLPSSMIDVSDGLAADLGHICVASNVGVVIEEASIPCARSNGSGLDPLEAALHGGEDYELCFTIASDRAADAARQVESKTGTKVSIIGDVTARGGLRIRKAGAERVLESRGWDHLKS